MGSILAPFRPSGHCVSLSGSVRSQLREEEQQQQQEQQEGSMSHYVSLYHCTNNGTKNGRKLLFYCFSRVSEGTLGSFWARFWRCSVLQGHCVSCPAACFFSFGRKSSSSNRSSRRVLCVTMSHCTNRGTKLVENYCFPRVSEGTLGSFWARFWRCSVLQGHCVPCPAGCVLSIGHRHKLSHGGTCCLQ